MIRSIQENFKAIFKQYVRGMETNIGDPGKCRRKTLKKKDKPIS